MPILRGLWRNDAGAVAATVALSLVGLIAVGGIAFDYSRMASLDTELQNAADQAALAAAGQLDGGGGACARAAAAASSLLTNNSLFANDGGGLAVTVASESACDAAGDVRFYQSYDELTDTPGDAATSDANARIVIVTVGGRKAEFALTPIVGLLDSGTIAASAVASLASAICNVPPLMMCSPSGGAAFPTAADTGRGVLLQPGPNVGAWAPGDYGYLDFGNGASGVATNLGRNNEVAGCVDMSDGIPTEPGNKASVTDTLNSRFDLYPAAKDTCQANGDHCPSENTHKDLAKTYEIVVNNWPKPPAAPPDNPVLIGTEQCGAAGQTLVDESNTVDRNGFSLGTPPPGLPRDTCHYGGSCANNKFGDGVWDRDGYLGPTHGTTAAAVATSLSKTSSTLTRWDIYKWELADKANRLARKVIEVSSEFNEQGKSGKGKYTFKNRCTFPQPVSGTAVVPGPGQKDRRVLTVAAVDCTGLNGKGNVVVKQWVDALLVQPSLARTTPYATGKEQIYIEIIGVAKKPNGQSAYQFYLKQRPRLIR